MAAKILVTGATGNVGREVVKELLNQADVRATMIHSERDSQQLPREVEWVYFKFEDPDTYAAAFRGVRAMFLLRPPTLSNVKKYIAPAINAAKAAGVEQIVFLSIVGVEKNSLVPHHKIEQSILASGLDWTFLRASFFMQNLNTTHRTEIQERSEIAVPVGSSKTSFIDVRDIGAIAARTLTEDGHRNHAYTLTGAEALDYYQIAEIMSSVLGKRIRYTNPSILSFTRQQLAAGRPLAFTLVMSALYSLTRFGAGAVVSPETAALLGRSPISFRQYVQDYRAAWGS